MNKNILDKYFLEETSVPENFIGWRVLGEIKNYYLGLFRHVEIFKTNPENWVVEFRVAIKSGLILVDPDCPEIYFIDSDKTIFNIASEICEEYKSLDSLTGLIDNNFLWNKANPSILNYTTSSPRSITSSSLYY